MADFQTELAKLKAEGLTFAQCITAFAAASDDPFVKAAQELVSGKEGELEVDDVTVISESEDGGAYVLSWVWVGNEEAGIRTNSEILEMVLEGAEEKLKSIQGLDEATVHLRNCQADWLEDLISNFADEIDGIESEVVDRLPGQIVWIDEDMKQVQFMPSDAISQLRLLAREAGLDDGVSDQAEKFVAKYGNKLDAILTSHYTGIMGNTYKLANGQLTASTYLEGQYVCKTCGSHEVSYDQSANDAYCAACGKWQNDQ